MFPSVASRLQIAVVLTSGAAGRVCTVADGARNAGTAELRQDLGYVERVPDPADGRAKFVRYTRKGRALFADAATIAKRLHAEIEAIIGARRLEELRSTLADICRYLEIGPAL